MLLEQRQCNSEHSNKSSIMKNPAAVGAGYYNYSLLNKDALARSLTVSSVFVAIVYAVCQCGGHSEVFASRGGDRDVGIAITINLARTNELVTHLHL